MEQNKIGLLSQMFTRFTGEKVETADVLPPSGSYREYVRFTGNGKSALGVFNPDKKENEAFVGFSEHFYAKGMKVGKVFEQDLANDIYLVEDLGNTTLFDCLQQNRIEGDFPDALMSIYKKTIEELILFQLKGSENLNFDLCYPRKAFDRQSMQWDLHYFKYYF